MIPKIEYPLYEIYVKSLGRNVKFRPFLVKEEKILLMAKEAKDPESIKLAVMQIINNCAAEPLNIDELPLFDVEMIMIKLRAKSIGESVRLTFTCRNEVDGEVCDTENTYSLNLEKVRYEIPESHTDKIQVNENLGIKLRYPTLTRLSFDRTDSDSYDLFLKMLLNSIEYIYDKESVHYTDKATEKELIEFVESLTPETINQIETFFAQSPKTVLEDTAKCKKCGFQHTIYTENLLDFFL